MTLHRVPAHRISQRLSILVAWNQSASGVWLVKRTGSMDAIVWRYENKLAIFGHAKPNGQSRLMNSPNQACFFRENFQPPPSRGVLSISTHEQGMPAQGAVGSSFQD